MKKNEKTYVIIFDKHANFKEIYVLNKSSDPFVVNPKSVGDQIYIYNQKEFKKIIESAMRYITEPVGEANDSHTDDNNIFANIGQQVILPDGNIGYIKSVKDGSKKWYLKYYKVPTGICSDSSSAMPTEAGDTDAAKTIKKDLEEYRSDGKTTCTLTGGVDINPKIGI